MKNPIYKQFIQYLENKDVHDTNKPYEHKKQIVLAALYRVDDGHELTVFDMVNLVQCINVSALTGKLEDFYSVSTSVRLNAICQCRAKNDESICSKCYANASLGFKAGLRLALEINYIIINAFDIPADIWKMLAIPSVNGKSRIESHGDVGSVQAAVNMNRIIESHEWLTFGVWTKNYYFWFKAFEKDGKHKNCVFIVSSDKINKVIELPDWIKPYVDKVFTVYNFKGMKKQGVNINCGYRHCKECGICYDTNNTTFYVNEILKKDTNKYKKFVGIE